MAEDELIANIDDQVLARMVTTIDDNTNGFRLDIIPMALSSDAGSQSLLHATLALSSYHLGREEDALNHKVKALKLLSESFKHSIASRLSQFAACMMLCVYSVSKWWAHYRQKLRQCKVFDASDTTWHLHLQGAKSISATLTSQERSTPSSNFFSSWFDYHETFSTYSHTDAVASVSSISTIKLPESNTDTRKIIGTLGSSAELLGLISCINQLRRIKDSKPWSPGQPPREALDIVMRIRSQLRNLVQDVHISTEQPVTEHTRHNRISLTAEFYRIGALMYLYEIVPSQTLPNLEVEDLVADGFAVLEQLEICTSPWPLFVLACNVTSDINRLKTLQVLDDMDQKRRIGNYQIIRGLIQAVWKQQDLAIDEKMPTQVDWRSLIDSKSSVPSFI